MAGCGNNDAGVSSPREQLRTPAIGPCPGAGHPGLTPTAPGRTIWSNPGGSNPGQHHQVAREEGATATKAIILIETAVGTTKGVASSLRGVAGIQSVDVVTGPYDVIAVIDVEDMRAIGSLVEQKIHGLSGVTRTVTCVTTG